VTAAVNIALAAPALGVDGNAHLISKLAQPLHMLFNRERYLCRKIACNFRL